MDLVKIARMLPADRLKHSGAIEYRVRPEHKIDIEGMSPEEREQLRQALLTAPAAKASEEANISKWVFAGGTAHEHRFARQILQDLDPLRVGRRRLRYDQPLHYAIVTSGALPDGSRAGGWHRDAVKDEDSRPLAVKTMKLDKY